jgi:hydrogenase maturation protein HypF
MMAASTQEQRNVLLRQLNSNVNTPLTSSMGRLFDAVAALAGGRQVVNYEAQAAIELEAQSDTNEMNHYSFGIDGGIIDPIPVVKSVIKDYRATVPISKISARFHNGIARMVLDTCRLIRQETGIKVVALSGGVWQNVHLLSKVVKLLETDRFIIYYHRSVPTNDGGLALGQAVIAWQRAR